MLLNLKILLLEIVIVANVGLQTQSQTHTCASFLETAEPSVN